jgi:hypothetical protein
MMKWRRRIQSFIKSYLKKKHTYDGDERRCIWVKVEQFRWIPNKGWHPIKPGGLGSSCQLVLVFASTFIMEEEQALLDEVAQAYPNAYIIGCSTAGEVYNTQVTQDSLVVTAVQFEYTVIKGATIVINEQETSLQAGERLAALIDKDELAHVFVLSDGVKVNGSELVDGLTRNLPDTVAVTGGLAGDGERFARTFVLASGRAEQQTITALGFYGERVRVGYGSMGGWDSFGPERLVTSSQGNILYELDGKSAVDLYKNYLGEYSKGLPASALLFPLNVRSEQERGVVRTILGIDEVKQSMIFAGDIPQGSYARFMKANCDRLVNGAVGAAKTSVGENKEYSSGLAILISCVGRKLVMKQRVEEEVEAVREVVGDDVIITGFYSYGEIAPFQPGAKCDLHNQTMTITLITEK